MEPKIFNLDRIKDVLKEIDLVRAMEEGFTAYSEGKRTEPVLYNFTFFLLKYPYQ